MNRPDTIIEIHRELVQEQAAEEYSGGDYEQAVGGIGYAATAKVTLELNRVWFVGDSAGRSWHEEVAGAPRDAQRHFAIELELTDSMITIDSVSCFPLLPLPPRTVTVPHGPRAGESRRIAYNQIPLFGRLTVHEHLERRNVDDRTQTIVLDFGEQDAPVLVASAPGAGHDSRLYGSSLQRRRGGVVAVRGADPRVLWELDEAQAYWITHSIAGELLVNVERIRHPGISDAQARIQVLDSFAAQLADAVIPEVEQLGDGGVLDLLPEPVEVDAHADDDVTAKELDVRVQTFQADGQTHESMVVQLRTLRSLPDAEELPASVLVDRPHERTGLAVTGYSILRQVRETVMNTFGLTEADFDADAPCLLGDATTVEIGGAERVMRSLDADIVSRAGDGELVVTGRVSAQAAMYDFDATFAIHYDMTLGAIPRDTEATESAPERRSVATLEQSLADAGARRRSGELASADYESEVKRLHDGMAGLPQTVGVQPVQARDPVIDADFSLTPAGYAASALGAAATVALLSLPATWPAGVAGLSALGAGGLLSAAIVQYLTTVLTLGWAGSGLGSREVSRSLIERPDGTALPTVGVPVVTHLTRQRLAVYFRQVPPRLPVTFVRKNDEEKVLLVGGPWPTDGARYVMSQDDAALLLDAGAVTLTGKYGRDPRIPLQAITGSQGRRLLVTAPGELDEPPAGLHEFPTE